MGEGRLKGLSVEGLERAEARAASLASRLHEARCDRDDAGLLKDEFALASAMMRHACRLGIARLAAPGGHVEAIPRAGRMALVADLAPVVDEYRRVWRLRNREGGLSDSAGRLDRLLLMYGE